MGLEFDAGKYLVGEFYGLDKVPLSGQIHFQRDGVVAEIPLPSQRNPHVEEELTSVLFVSTEMTLRLIEGWPRAFPKRMASINSSKEVIEFDRAIEAASVEADYQSVNGLESHIEGLAEWAEITAVGVELNLSPSGALLDLHFEAPDPRGLGGPMGASIVTTFSYRPDSYSESHQVKTLTGLRTVTPELAGWYEHARSHRMMQELLSVCYGRPCPARLTQCTRADDQLNDDSSSGPSRGWRAVYMPSYGRKAFDSSWETETRRRPLFTLTDCDPVALVGWMDEWGLWSRPTWIIASTFFDSGVAVEVRLMQRAVALEALGHALRAKQTGSSRRKSFTENVEFIFQTMGWKQVWRHLRWPIDQWCKKLNAAYKRAKHADNEMPDLADTVFLNEDALWVFRCWQAWTLGVPESTIIDSLA